MRNHKLLGRFFIGLVISFFALNSNAQNIDSQRDSLLNVITDIDKRIKDISTIDTSTVSGYSVQQIPDSILLASGYNRTLLMPRDSNGLVVMPKREWIPVDRDATFADTIIYDPAFLPVVFDGKVIPENLNFLRNDSVDKNIQEFHLIDRSETFAPMLDDAKRVDSIRKHYYQANPRAVRLNELAFNHAPVINQTTVERKDPYKELISADQTITIAKPEVERFDIKKVYWLKDGEHNLKMSHNSMSDNWNGSGGDESYYVQNYHKFNIRYKRGKIDLNNTIEWKLNFQRTPADTVHSVSIQEDYLRTYTVLGLQAFSKWSYTTTLEMKTPLFNSYPKNSDEKKTALFSPLNINAGIGMSYNLNKQFSKNKYRKINLSLDLKPLSINYTLVRSDGVKETKFGIEEGERSKTDYGSTINLNSDLYFNRYTRLVSRFKYFSNYEKVILEYENTLSFELNRYLSTSINLNLRFDDGIGVKNRDEKWGYFQYNETLGFGLSYKW